MKNNIGIVFQDNNAALLNLEISLQLNNYNIYSICDSTLNAESEITKNKPDLLIIDISSNNKAHNSEALTLAKHLKSDYSIPFVFLIPEDYSGLITKAKSIEPYGYLTNYIDAKSVHNTIQMAFLKHQMENKRKKHLTKLQANKSIIAFGDYYYININTKETFYKDKKVKLTKKESAFLKLLALNLGHVITFQEATKYLWKKEDKITQNNLRTLVWRLRSKLVTNIIKNDQGVGYYIDS
jgi:DNA-binding response OmpR family regulator